MLPNCVRRHTDKGLADLQAALLASGTKYCDPALLTEALIDGPEHTEIVLEDVQLPEGPFANKYEFGKALVEALGEDGVRKVLADDNVWPWFSVVYRDLVMPRKASGLFVGNLARHVIGNLGKRSSKSRHRHLVRGAVMAVSRFGEHARGLMSKPSEHTTFEEQVMSRSESLRLAGAVELVKAVSILYFDPRKQRHKRNAAKKVPGSMLRLIDVIHQIDVGYDIDSLSCDEMLALLPQKEFGPFLPPQVDRAAAA